MCYLVEILNKAKQVLRAEGVTALLKRGFRFLASSLHYERYYCCQYVLKERDDFEFMPRIDGFCFKIVSSK